MARPTHEMHEHYDVVVVGSGYGGGIAASRLARAGRSVCVLERGKELHPGEYPDSPASALRQVQAQTRRGHVGSPTALIDFNLGSDIGVVRGCGLGGTSLINANVAKRAEPEIFDDDRWPSELRGNGADVLEPYYARAETMLGSQYAPVSIPELPKVRALEASAAALGATVEPAKLNVTFADGTNAAGIEQRACSLCGDCVTGCNHWAKNTVLMNYLPDAHRHGAHIFTEIQARTVRKRPDGTWLIEYVDLSVARRRPWRRTRFVTADVVVLAAGSLGSTEILLRSRYAGLDVSERLGLSFTGNGDVVAFAFDTDRSVRGIGTGREPVTDPVGTCINAMIELDTAEGPVLIQEGAIPGALGRAAGGVWGLSALAFGRDGSRGLERVLKRLGQLVEAAFSTRRGPTDRTLTYLVMSVDDDSGELVLEDDRLNIRWPNVSQRPVFDRLNETVRQASAALGGTFVPNPIWASPFGSTLLTVQPLGGCDMGDDARSGVVNHKGQVFAGRTGTRVHDGLYVADGAIVPRPLGANPSLTISALAERICELMIEDSRWEPPPPGSPPPAQSSSARRATMGLTFNDRLHGHISTRVTGDYDQGEVIGRDEGSPIDVVVNDRLRRRRAGAAQRGDVRSPHRHGPRPITLIAAAGRHRHVPAIRRGR
ncbi:MAG TPA: GMC family oxidoreductase [Actinomycetota bacterium]|nr:GMC family oxidoreductase [Actinomycetota bacterium]